ncbi:Dam family site-specific DNA-(adenine-N6)-methyltransferase [Mucilaginibacter sp. JRF]|uniref:Dam family site-specific DNA-(adenine-N6)-methyltransferase n=1 Tax=Mucilaginibacter sp. JRF TaxID=2780088 RepID=UPI00187F2FCD|nr:Dam family site-specific DNA-(adenine-N6)-methyltransferase [Mucilaginibacter sp. JRF]MBE9585486.1 Dam family site-specific DNA-(adenine-N6)-methyltransferase [Mucilaginibacter sp. JRF]
MIALEDTLFPTIKYSKFIPPKNQLLKWVGNKQKFAAQITKFFPRSFNDYYEPFLGSGAVLATVHPISGIGSDTFSPLIEIWNMLKSNPDGLVDWYKDWREKLNFQSKEFVYEDVKAQYNANPNGKDFLYLSRSCYGGIIRFRRDGHMSTPCGVHTPIPIKAFKERVVTWHPRVQNTTFINQDYKSAFAAAKAGDLIYCDPPYSHSQSILYGAQDFSLTELLESIWQAKERGVYVALSIDGNKKSGNMICDLPIPENLFEREVYIDCGKSMLRRFQIEGQKMSGEGVFDRLMLTY